MPRRMWVVLIGALGLSLSAYGQSITDWEVNNNQSGQSYSYAGGSAALIGTNIAIEDVTGEPTPLHNNVTQDITDGLLNFNTGTGSALGNWSWDSGSGAYLTITGCIAGVTAVSCTGSNNVTLVSDDFTSISVVYDNNAAKMSIEVGYLTGTINSAVAAYYGVPTNFESPDSTAQFAAKNTQLATPGSAFHVGPDASASGELDLVAAAEDWNLSNTMGLFAFGLAVFGVARRFGLMKAVSF